MSKRKNFSRTRVTKDEYDLLQHYRETGTVPQEYAILSDKNILKTNDKYNDIKGKYKSLIEENDDLKSRLDIYEEHSKRKIYKHQFAKKNSGTSESVAVVQFSDVHIEEKIEPETVNYKNEYTPAIGKNRVKKFHTNLRYMIDCMRKNTKINTLVYHLGGDFISGYIHDELIENNWMSPQEAIIVAHDLICGGIDFLLEDKKLEKIIVPCSFGNHARTTKKKTVSTAYKNNLEWMMYNIIANKYRSENRVEFIIGKGCHTYVSLFDKYNIRCHHGDLISYSSSMGGIRSNANNAIAQWNKSEDIFIYLDMFAHHHTYEDGGIYMVNGCISGFSSYAHSIKASYDVPKQIFGLIERDRGKTIVAPIFCE